jgi:hypothetical protein
VLTRRRKWGGRLNRHLDRCPATLEEVGTNAAEGATGEEFSERISPVSRAVGRARNIKGTISFLLYQNSVEKKNILVLFLVIFF